MPIEHQIYEKAMIIKSAD